jgi:hypothetical protein
MRRPLLFACALAAHAPAEARSDDAHGVDDPRFALSLRAGILHVDDETFEATWYRPATLEGSAWILRAPRRWLDGFQLYGSVGLESTDVDYRERPGDREESLAGIHHAAVRVERGVAFGFGARVSLYDDGRFRLAAFADLSLPPGASDVEVEALLIDLQGLKIDVAKAVRGNATVDYEGRTFRAGATAAVTLRLGGLRWTPYLTSGWMRYRAEIGFETDDELKDVLTAFGVDHAVLGARVVEESNAFFAPGVRLDLGRAWSLETQALLGRYDGTRVAAGALGAAWRF